MSYQLLYIKLPARRIARISLGMLFLLGLLLLVGCEIESTSTPLPTPDPGGETWWQVYFTDPNRLNDPDALDGSIEAELIDRIEGAQESIHIAAFEFNLTPVAQALIAAHENGVEVQWVTDDENGLEADSEEGHGQFAMLQGADIEVRDDGRGALMHNKFIIFDGKTVWTGATNLTVNGIFHNNNNVIVIDSPPVAAMFEREFSEMWAGEFGPKSPSTVNQQQTSVVGTPIQVLFASEDEAISYIIPLLSGAQESIHFMVFSFTYDGMGEAMLERAGTGVEVTGIFETRGSETEFSELPPLYCAGLPVRQDGNPSTFHHKVIVIDGRIVITGSLNFSNNADENNDENVVILNNPAIAAQYLREFERRWVEAKQPNLADMNCN
ncbi:MAG: hypothetical protein A2W36_06170 [Chloroflexi bacterium RBG_16_58_14]|nr:MAG: hypothetical protein A2W36_06170 [Chloroflexi bacterium RBG_16_58_14]